jgi:starch synthase/alpha-amylase
MSEMGMSMSATSDQPRILFVTPEVSFVPIGSGKNCEYFNIKPDGFAGFLSQLFENLFARGADVHITQPDYRSLFSDIFRGSNNMATRKIPKNRMHLTEDRAFFYTGRPELNDQWENIRISLAFQREVFHQILPLVQPDLIHCHGWMTGLIPAMAASLEIPCIFTLQNFETGKSPLAEIEDMGIDAAAFWQHLYFDRFPLNYEETREINPVNFLLSGILAADYASAAGPAHLLKIGESLIRFPGVPLGQVLSEKLAIGCSAVSDDQMAIMQYIDLYEKLLKGPIFVSSMQTARWQNDFCQDADQFDRSSGTQINIQYALR